MDGEQVRVIEEQIEAAIATAMRKLARDGAFNPPPSERVFHLMAKATTAVFEAYLDYARNPTSGFVTATHPLGDGIEYSVRAN